MSLAPRVSIRYQPTTCTLLDKEVWAVLMQQADGSWRVVNCLDKDAACFNVECDFTTSGGSWPYQEIPPGPTEAPQGTRPTSEPVTYC